MTEPLNDAEKMVLGFVGGYRLPAPGGFFTMLIEAMFHADRSNTFKLKLAYPELMTAVMAFKTSEELHDRGMEFANLADTLQPDKPA